MSAILAALPVILQYLPLAVQAEQSFVKWITGLRTAAQQSTEWTPELEAAFVAYLVNLATQGQWQVNAPVA